ncbi:hypothetical protein J056_001506 [Wallemia ichthyophaga EXF-994]|uniref:Uncharacterized protein n=1 Tax=Wallemia ichthyophaga (strain EXF-994 / CBS 113033) TaxID=1299270 RepID=R9AC48_WALI9|nr:uncharacterized protein J056_001506 [Wallemia ichthyophaga EXF-994]EOQ99674.1 hypothetical protein J056_001506 [Wallemia ichthyophaga EXF-994]
MTALREITIGDKAPFNSIHAKCVELDIDTEYVEIHAYSWCLRFKQKGREIASVTVGLVDDEKMRTIDYRDELIWRSLHVHLDEYRIVQFSPIEMRREKGPRISLLGNKFRSSDTPSLVAAEVVDGAQSGLFRQSQLPKIRIYDESQKVWDKVIDPIAKEHKLSHINRKAVNDFVPAIGC